MKLKALYPPRRNGAYLPVVMGDESYKVAEDGTLDVPAGEATEALLKTCNFAIAEKIEHVNEPVAPSASTVISNGDKQIDLATMTKKELTWFAENDLGMDVSSRASKEELIAVILAHVNGAAE